MNEQKAVVLQEHVGARCVWVWPQRYEGERDYAVVSCFRIIGRGSSKEAAWQDAASKLS